MLFYFERSDVRGGGRVVLPEGTVSIGRSPKNTIVLSAEDRCVSAIHAVVYVDSKRLLLQDTQSTNGTFVNGRRVQECVLEVGDEVRLGRSGPRFLVVGGGGAGGVDDGIRNGINNDVNNYVNDYIDNGIDNNINDDIINYIDNDINDNVDNYFNNDINDDIDNGIDNDIDIDIDNDIDAYINSYSNAATADAARRVSAGTVAVAVMIAALAVLGIALLAMPSKPKKRPLGGNGFFTPPRPESLAPVNINNGHDDNDPPSPSQISPSPPLSVPTTATTAASTIGRINAVLARFGETDYRAPPEMVERVEHYIALNTGPRRRSFAATLRRGGQYFPMIRRVFSEKNLPLELAYVSMQESGFNAAAVSHAGAVGLWQFMPATARQYGLEVSSRVDERTDPEKSTYAAAAYFRHLIAIFGGKSSVMLSMAAYNAGEQRIINALKKIDDLIRDRDFWYLYRMGWLADETNEYIPQIIALIIISENLEEYGFNE